MLGKFAETRVEWIINENKRIFNIDVCRTCKSQHFEGYARLKNYYKNIDNMAKQNKTEEVKKDAGLKLKSEFIGSVHCNGKESISLDEVNPLEADKIFTAEEINQYFEQAI